MSSYGSGPTNVLTPQLEPWMQRILVCLFGLYVIELMASNMGFTVGALVWRPFGMGFGPHQLVTRFLVQGNNVFGVLISLVVLYFFLPAIDRLYSPRQAIQSLVFAVIGGTSFALVLDLIGFLNPGAAMGWSVLLMPMVVLFGLGMPNGIVQLFFVLPVRAVWFVWGSIALAGLSFLASPTLATADAVGAWCGVMAWYHFLGPGRRRRELTRQAASIERDLRRFQVIEGGKTDPDDWVH